ncbi:HAD family hydrolase [Pseudomonas putida]|nr:HAD family hydrolase [Pseudomonas putida]
MNSSYKALYEFGYGFLGPILNCYIRKIAEHSATHRPICLAREGWVLFNTLKYLEDNGLIFFKAKPLYLKVSRTVLFRSQLGNPDIWELAFASKFDGTVLDLLLKRFGFQLHEAFSLLPQELLGFKVSLPDDLQKLSEWFAPHNARMHAYVEPTRNALLTYFNREGLISSGLKPLMLDIGYAGTIQKILTRMFDQSTDGLYFITTAAGNHKIGQQTATMKGVFKENVKWSEGYLMLERSLLLESIMTAPEGQLVDIRLQNNGELQFFHGRLAAPQNQYQDLQTIFAGAIDAIGDGFKMDITYSTEEIECLFSAYATTPSAIPKEAFHLFSIDDDFSGNGVISPTQLFGLH